VGLLNLISEASTDEEKLNDLVRNGQMIATVSLKSMLEKFPELNERADQIDVDDYDYLYTIAWVYCGVLLIERNYKDGLPKRLLNIPFDKQLHKATLSNDPNLKPVEDALERRWERWFDQGIDGYNDLAKFMDIGFEGLESKEQIPGARDFILGQWFLWNLFGERPNWASIKLTQTIGGIIMRGAVSTLE